MSSQEPVQGTPVTDVNPPNHCETWKSAYAQRLTSKKTGEEFDYFVRAFQRDSGLRGPEALLYALKHAYTMTKANDLRDDEKQVDKLPKGSKLCIVGAGMAGMCLVPAFGN